MTVNPPHIGPPAAPLPLPIDALLPEVVAALRRREALVLEAPPGAGKTTRVPPALLDAGLAGARQIIVLQPRRLATRLAAARVAQELGEPLGQTVGYQIRFEDVSSNKTRIHFVTEGILTRRLLADPTLANVGAVILDEFHERHLASDLALALLRRLQLGARPDLKLLVMSATLNAAPLAAWLGDAPTLRSSGRPFEVELEHLPQEDPRPLDKQVLGALKRLLQRGLDGHVLVFLPGAAEIRRSQEACAELAERHGLELHVLHGDLPAAEQDRALRTQGRRKVILSTNVAETSVTIEGVAAVIDSGLARVASHSPWSGLPNLSLAKVSKASATQRAGRAGRTRAGVCLRLYTRADYESRPAADAPEIRRLDLTEAALSLKELWPGPLAEFPFFEAPPAASIEAAEALLRRLTALQIDGRLSPTGERLLRFPLHPRLARLIVEAERRGVADDGVTLAALLSVRDLRAEAGAKMTHHSARAGAPSGPSDLLELLERFRAGVEFGARRADLDPTGLKAVERTRHQLLRMANARNPGPARREEALLIAILTAYPDRVAKRRKARSSEVVLCAGGAATLDAYSVVHDAELMVAVEAEERKGSVVVRSASRVEPEWLLELFPEAMGDVDQLAWNSATERVEHLSQLTYGSLVLEETRKPAPLSPEASRLLAEAAIAKGAEAFASADELSSLRCRLDTLRAGFPEAHVPELDVLGGLRTLAEQCRSFEELRAGGLVAWLRSRLSPEHSRLLDRETPERVTLPGGRAVRVNYELGRPPWIESRLQDFFGMTKGPALGRTPLVLHLLAPNHRAVQITTDLAGFWDRHYPAIRRELMRQYPKHAWPEDPRTARPPEPRRR